MGRCGTPVGAVNQLGQIRSAAAALSLLIGVSISSAAGRKPHLAQCLSGTMDERGSDRDEGSPERADGGMPDADH
ncbi:hypothetical protein GCM10027456_67590 [Kineosporia babensis]